MQSDMTSVVETELITSCISTVCSGNHVQTVKLRISPGLKKKPKQTIRSCLGWGYDNSALVFVLLSYLSDSCFSSLTDSPVCFPYTPSVREITLTVL